MSVERKPDPPNTLYYGDNLDILRRYDKLYYVGLAIDLRRRLKQHLKDKHVDSWDRFSIYITIGDHHIKEMESLLLRITRPAGNSQYRQVRQLRKSRPPLSA